MSALLDLDRPPATANRGVVARWLALPSRILAEIAADAPAYGAVLLHAAVGLVFLLATSDVELTAYRSYARTWVAVFVVIAPIFFGAITLAQIALHTRWRVLTGIRRLITPRVVARLAAGLLLLLAVQMFLATFTSVKIGLSASGGFTWDLALANLDAAIHFGQDPWRWLYTVGQHDWLAAVLDRNYGGMWFFYIFGTLAFVAISPRADAIRLRYMLCFLLTWAVLGNLLAGVFISAGPAFYGAVTGDAARFGDQLRFLADAAGERGSGVVYQNYLWTLYVTGESGLGGGISAFPSVHIGTVTLNALFLREVDRRIGYAAFAYAGVFLMSSVYLGWHYAVDGYASIVVVTLIYAAMRRWMPAAPRRRATVGT